MATQDIGRLGRAESPPVFVEWKWYYNVPSLPLWILVVLLLVLFRKNRRLHAWFIFLPLLAVVLGWKMLLRLFSASDAEWDAVGMAILTMAAAWSCEWLVSPWLAARSAPAGLALAFLVMLAVGALSYVSQYGLTTGTPIMALVSHAIYAIVLLASVSLAARSCRRKYRPEWFMTWLALWMGVVSIAGGMLLMLVFVSAIVATGKGPTEILMELVMSAIPGFIFACVLGVLLYAVNLPFMLLAFRVPFYGQRFLAAFRLPQPVEAELLAAASAAPTAPAQS